MMTVERVESLLIHVFNLIEEVGWVFVPTADPHLKVLPQRYEELGQVLEPGQALLLNLLAHFGIFGLIGRGELLDQDSVKLVRAKVEEDAPGDVKTGVELTHNLHEVKVAVLEGHSEGFTRHVVFLPQIDALETTIGQKVG